MAGSRLVTAVTTASALYGVGVGLQAKVKSPQSLADARQNASLGSFGLNAARDVGLGLIDDAVMPLALIAARRIPGLAPYRGMMNLAQKGFIVGGTAVAGAVLGHDYQNYIAARKYVAANDDLTLSQQMLPDPRINSIEGFRNKGLAGLQRRDMTGIASPSAGGIFYRMWHNPFADTLNNAIASPDQQRADDPRSKALGFSIFGGIAGAAIGSPKGLGRATVMGLIGSTMGGMYGIASSHNPDPRLNAEALGAVALSATPTLAMAGALYGLSSGRLGGFGKAVSSGLAKTAEGMSASGRWLTATEKKSRGFQLGVVDGARSKRDAFRGSFVSSGAAAGLQSRFEGAAHAMGWHNAPDVSGFFVDKVVPNAVDAAVLTALAPQRAAGFVSNTFVAPLLSHEMKGRWEQSLGIGHLITIAPHQVALGAAAVGITSGHRGKHSTNTMPSNNAR